MLGTQFYNSSTEKVVISFGTLFNNILLERRNNAGTLLKTIKVPLAYGPKEKFIRKLSQETKSIQSILPRMSFEIVSMVYDDIRKGQTTSRIKGSAETSFVDFVTVTDGGSGYTDETPPKVVFSGGGGRDAEAVAVVESGVVTEVNITNPGREYTSNPTVTFDNTNAGGGETPATATATIVPLDDIISWVHNAVPYDLNIALNIMVKNSNDGLRIIEQIVPFFTPDFTITINELPEIGIKRDIPIILNSVSPVEDWEGDFLTRRMITYVLDFTVKAWFYGPIRQSKTIKDATANTYLDPSMVHITQTYNVKPDPLNSGPEDNFGFTETLEEEF